MPASFGMTSALVTVGIEPSPATIAATAALARAGSTTERTRWRTYGNFSP